MELLEQLVHPGIMQIYELLHDDEYYYVVSELVTDGTLFDYLIEQTETKYRAIPEHNAKILVH
jgi:serine/threonine protein kinase